MESRASFRVGEWLVEPQQNLLQQGERQVRLEPKVMDVLCYFAEHAGEVLTKERLIQAVWPDTFVGDESLTRTIVALRRALGDDSHAPSYVETIPKRGYRLSAAVEFLDARPDSGTAEAPPGWNREAASQATGFRRWLTWKRVSSDSPESATARPGRVALLLVAGGSLAMITAVIMVAMGWWADSESDSGYAGPIRITPFTVEGGFKGHPRFSPDGERVAYEWNGPGRDNTDIYVKALGLGATPLRLTDDPDWEYVPAWSPDGREIVFTRLRADGTRAIFLVPSTGGPERKLLDLEGRIFTTNNFGEPLGAACWSPDGKTLVFSDAPTDSDPSRLVRLSIPTLARETLSHPPERTLGDLAPEFSPDGLHVAFVRSQLQPFGGWSLWVQSVGGGEARRLTDLQSDFAIRPSWSADGLHLFFLQTAVTGAQIWRVNMQTGTLDMVAGLGPGVGRVSAWGDRMLLEQRKNFPLNIWRIPVSTQGTVSAERLMVSSFTDFNPDFSPDGQRIAFASHRGGSGNIWLCKSDGTDPVQLTQFKEHSGSARWSPDGKRIVFDSLHSGNADLWLIDPEGGQPQQLTSDPSDEVMGSWSRDGRSIYFSSRRTGRSEIYRIPSEGGEAVQITANGGWYARESKDGRSIYYSKPPVESGLYRLPLDGSGKEELVTAQSYWVHRGFAVGARGVYFLLPAGKETPEGNRINENRINFLDGETGVISVLYQKEGPFHQQELAISPDEKWLLFCEMPNEESELMLVENFH